MTRNAAALAATTPAGDATPAALHPDRALWAREVRAYESHLTIKGKSARTIETYKANLETFARWATDAGVSLDPRTITRRDAQAFAADQVARYSENTAKGRIVSVGTFFAWLVTEWAFADEHRADPFAGVEGPRVAHVRVPVLSQGDVDRLLAATAGKGFDDLRDRAILALYLSAGLRRSEGAALDVDDVDMANGFVTVRRGKGNKPRLAPFGATAHQALSRYMRARDHHRDAALPALFLVTPGHGHRGRMSGHGLAVMLDRRSQAAGLGHVHLHQLRHTWTHEGLAAETPEGAMMVMGGWSNRSMLDRYGADLAQERALTHYRDPLARGRRGR